MAREIKTVHDLFVVIRRRKWSILIPATSIFLLAALAAYNLPKKYRSTATILIEAQEVPDEYVKANISSYADQRIQTINQQITGTPRLMEMIQRLNLYDQMKGKASMEEVVDKMRKDIKLTPISADVVDPRSGRPAQATIAFSISYQGGNPRTVQQVASELSSLYLAENLKGRAKQSSGTYRFLQEEMQSIKKSLDEVDKRLSVFKQKNLDSLPELSQANVQSFEQVDRDIRLLSDQLRSSREKEGYLRSQLANVQPEQSSNQKESLRQLKLRLAELKTNFSEKHPDVRKTRLEIAELEKQMKAASRTKDAGQADNPAYVTLAAQLAAARSDSLSLTRQITEMEAKRATYQRRIQASPRVEEGYKTILAERNSLQQKYDDLSRKAMEASVAHGLEKEQLGERFTLVDPARLPLKPVSPNVRVILLIGLLIGLGAGAGLAAIRESCDDMVRSSEELSEIAGFVVLATIPELPGIGGTLARRRAMVAASALALAAIAAALYFYLYGSGSIGNIS